MKRGVPPTFLKERTGELTPPTKTSWDRLKSRSDFLVFIGRWQKSYHLHPALTISSEKTNIFVGPPAGKFQICELSLKIAMISAFLFDFGGTLDSDGQHWLDRFYRIYEQIGLSALAKDRIKEAFYWAD